MGEECVQTLFEQHLQNEAETAAFGAKIATIVQKSDVICLIGDLGAGKTCFARGFVRAAGGAGPDMEIPSPTFTLVQTYDAPAFSIWHFDFYRIESPEEVYELGVEEAFDTGVSLVEWPEKASEVLPANRLEISLVPDGDGRKVRLTGSPEWASRIEKLRLSV